MKITFAAWSILLFGVSVVVLLVFTLFDSTLAGMSLGMQRLTSFLGLVLPSATGALFGVVSLMRKEGRGWLAIIGVALNIPFALFHLMITLFAG